MRDVVREVVIQAGSVAIRARLRDTPTADSIWAALPIEGEARTWGHEVYFDAPVSSAAEPDAVVVVKAGDIAFWPDGDAIAIGFGPTPLSRTRDEIRLAGPCNVWAEALDDVRQLKSVHPGAAVSVREAGG
jgi:hypothetical protein